MIVRFLSSANRDLDAILREVRERSPQGARRVADRVDEIIVQLEQHPHSGPSMNEGGVHRLPLTPYPYIVFYRLTKDAVEVVGVRHAARDPASMPDAP